MQQQRAKHAEAAAAKATDVIRGKKERGEGDRHCYLQKLLAAVSTSSSLSLFWR